MQFYSRKIFRKRGVVCFLSILLISLYTSIQGTDRQDVTIKELQQEHVDQAKSIFYQIIHEQQLTPCSTVEEAVDIVKQRNIDDDYDNAIEHYFNNRGTFFVVLKDGRVVGTGAFRSIDDATCELKRFYFLPEARGRGYATLLIHKLVEYACQLGYTKMVLEVYMPEAQKDAVVFYRKLGFYPIPSYRPSSAQLQMECDSLQAVFLRAESKLQ